MNYVEKMLDGMHTVLNLNAATLSGAIDIVVVPQPDGTLKSSPFHVRFGKLNLLNSSEKIVTVFINEEPVDLKMKLGSAGEAFFVLETEESTSASLLTSPIGSPPMSPVPKRRPATDLEMSTHDIDKMPVTLTSKLEAMILRDEQITSKTAPDDKSTDTQETIELARTPPIPISGSGSIRDSSNDEDGELGIRFGTLDTTLDELSQPLATSPNEDRTSGVEPQQTFSWRWGALPKVKNTENADSDTESSLYEKEKLSKEAEKTKAGWMGSVFRIFKGTTQEPRSLARSDSDLVNADSPENSSKADIPELDQSNPTVPSLQNSIEENGEALVSEDDPYIEVGSPKPEQSIEVLNQPSFTSPGTSPPNSIEAEERRDLPSSVTPNHSISITVEPPKDDLASSTDSKIAISIKENDPESLDIPKPLLSMAEVGDIKIEMSKCGNINVNDEATRDKIFQDNLISFEEFSSNPDLIFDQNILFKIRDKVYPWSVVGPVIISLLVFKKPLDTKVLEQLENKYRDKSKAQEKKGWSYWWSWKSTQQPQKAPVKPPEATTTPLKQEQKNSEPVVLSLAPVSRARKSLRPTSDQLKSLNLRNGANDIRFSVTSKYQGTRDVRATIYLWNPDTKIVISDVDGTITKSDVFGHILPMLGRDWSHSGIAELYSNVKNNNYQILYLTSRPIGSANITRGYINTLKQGEKTLPQGPILMSPHRLLSSLHQEVLLRRPDEFKIACLKDIQSLFPQDGQPFYAGFGNRPTDAISYRAVNIPLGKIFIINYKGEISIMNYTYKKTYSTLNELINEVFPPIADPQQTTALKSPSLRTSEQWNTWNYWKAPMPSAQDIEAELKKDIKKK